jgi:hypothetical protein
MDGLQSKFSLRQTVAMTLAGIDTTSLAVYSETTATAPALVHLREKISIDFQDNWPQTLSELEVETANGRRFAARRDSGVPAVDIDEQGRRLADKFISLATPVLGAARTSELCETIANLDNLADFATAARLTAI